MAEPIEEFLEQAAAERKPFSEQEKKNAMIIARKVWIKAMERGREARESGMLVLEEPLSRKHVFIYDKESSRRAGLQKIGKSNIDLMIAVVAEARDKEECPMSLVGDEAYYFSPDEVIKVSKSIELPDAKILDKIDRHPAQSDILMSKYQRRLNERRVEKFIHPDEKELNQLLDLIIVAKGHYVSSASKVVPR
ncbi:MAG: hypothetical protein Q7R31_03870 [Candidatus Levybacteria bacterium]|nr:hypothetical protein [Candidatus Levybacteria bacterium]